MKKKITIISGICTAIILVGLYVFFASSMGKPKVSAPDGHYTSDELHFLQQVGLGNAKNLDLHEDYDAFTNPDLFNYYKNKFNLRYFSKPGLDKFCQAFTLIYGQTKDFTGEIPSKNIAELKTNLAKIQPKEEFSLYYFNHDVEQGVPIEYIPEGEVLPEAKTLLNSNFPELVWLGTGVVKDVYSAKYQQGGSLILHKSDIKRSVNNALPLLVCAPASMFNTAGKDIVDNQLVEHKRVDPMIIAVTETGYVVLTYWAN